jgi:hypothetical protein
MHFSRGGIDQAGRPPAGGSGVVDAKNTFSPTKAMHGTLGSGSPIAQLEPSTGSRTEKFRPNETRISTSHQGDAGRGMRKIRPKDCYAFVALLEIACLALGGLLAET